MLQLPLVLSYLQFIIPRLVRNDRKFFSGKKKLCTWTVHVYAKLTSDSLSCKSTATKEGAIGIGRERVGKAN